MGSLLSIGSGKSSTNFNTKQKGKMSAERKISARKLSMDMQRKLSAISNCSDVSNLSVMLGMEPNDFKSTIQNILELDLGEDWPESEDESENLRNRICACRHHQQSCLSRTKKQSNCQNRSGSKKIIHRFQRVNGFFGRS